MSQSLTLTLLLLITVVGAFVPQKSPAFGLTLSVAVDTSEIKNGMTLNIDNEPYKVLSFSIMKQARGAAKTTIKFKNLVRADCFLHSFTHTHMPVVSPFYSTFRPKETQLKIPTDRVKSSKQQ